MKIFKMVFFISALLGMPITAFLLGQVWLGAVFTIFYVIFGIIEVTAKLRTGRTVSQQVLQLSLPARIILCSAMALGWGALIAHFMGLL